MSFASNMVSSARRLIRTYGQNVTFSRVVEGSFIPTTGDIGASTSSTYNAYVAPMEYKASEIDNVSIMANDCLAWVEINASESIPVVGDVVTISGQIFRVMNVQKITAQGTTIVYKLQLRI